MVIHDLIGIGFGPSNIALAIALHEKRQAGRRLEAWFIEKQDSFAWHKGMMLDHAHMQISFLKDLATLRNPTSRFTFINYLHEKGRLPDFINLKSFYPSRHEFNDYLAWAAAQFEDSCSYGEEVVEVMPEMRDGEVELLRVKSRGRTGKPTERLARNLVVSVGGTPNIPAAFKHLRDDARVVHSSRYLHDLHRLGEARRIAVIGAGQSAAEIFMDLQGRPNAPQVDLIMRSHSIRPSDDSPFVNEIFNAEYTDHVYHRSEEERAALREAYWHTNYSVADHALIQQIFNTLYEQKISGDTRLRLLRRHAIGEVRADADGVHLALTDGNSGWRGTLRYDAVILATGYQRLQHKELLRPLAPYLGDFSVDRHYRVESTPDFHPAIFLQGACEATHGLSDTLLSVTSVRTGEIGGALWSTLPAQPSVPSSRDAPRQVAKSW